MVIIKRLITRPKYTRPVVPIAIGGTTVHRQDLAFILVYDYVNPIFENE